MRAILLAAALALSGCTAINEHVRPDPAWPKLQVVEHRVGAFEMLGRCYQYLPLPMKLLGGIPFACAEIDLDANRCDIWALDDSDEWVMEHERLHCAGYDHHGSTQLRDLLVGWRSR